MNEPTKLRTNEQINEAHADGSREIRQTTNGSRRVSTQKGERMKFVWVNECACVYVLAHHIQ